MQTIISIKRGVPLPDYVTVYANQDVIYPLELGDTSEMFPNLIPTYDFVYEIDIGITDIFKSVLSMFDVPYPISIQDSNINNLICNTDGYYPISIGNK
jgi:hypothetical protein